MTDQKKEVPKKKKKRSKVLSIRLPIADYAKLLIECDGCDKDFSEFIKEKLYLGVGMEAKSKATEKAEQANDKLKVEVEKLKKALKDAKEDNTILKNENKKIGRSASSKDGMITKVNNEKKSAIEAKEKEIQKLKAEVEKLKKALKDAKSGGEVMAALNKGMSEGAKELKKELSTQKGRATRFENKLRDTEKELEKITERLNKANKFLEDNEIGTNFLGLGEIKQF